MLRWLAIVAAASAGLALGLGGYTFAAARGYSYLTDDPAACANCHIMGDHVAAWQKSSHRAVATCNDCHAPHDNFVHKYFVKAENGFVHSLNFTTGRHPDPLRIREKNRRVTESACLYCHAGIAATIAPTLVPSVTPASTGTAPPIAGVARHPESAAAPLSCIACHASVGHWVR